MVELFCINKRTREIYRQLISLDDILGIAEIPDTHVVFLVSKRYKRVFFKKKRVYTILAEPFDIVKEKIQNAKKKILGE